MGRLGDLIHWLILSLILYILYASIPIVKLNVDYYGYWRWKLAAESVIFSPIVYSQFVHETARFTSDIYKECNNPSGMKPNKRGFCRFTCRGHCGYVSIQDGIKDYAKWQLERLLTYGAAVRTEEDYYTFLTCVLKTNKGTCCSYAEDPHYLAKVQRYRNQLWLPF